MKRILIGLIAAAVLGAGGWFGFNLYAKHRATAEVEAAFEMIRSSGGKASHGKIDFDLPTRTVTIEDIAIAPGLFTTDPAQAMGQAAQVEAGAFELSLRDSGVVDLVVAQFSRMQNVSRDAARRAIVEMIRAQGEKIAASNADVRMAVDALAGFVETSGQTLTVKLTPRAKVPLMQLMQLSQSDPESALAQFRIEASTGL